jgi:hypothetical protein
MYGFLSLILRLLPVIPAAMLFHVTSQSKPGVTIRTFEGSFRSRLDVTAEMGRQLVLASKTVVTFRASKFLLA